MKIGLYFGSFNPIHMGHLIIAETMRVAAQLDKVWLVVSPQNPLKDAKSLLNAHDRLHLVNLAVEGNPYLEASNIEFHLPKPSYTIDTLTYLKEKHPQHQFSVIMGGDSLQNLPKWKNYEALIAQYNILVYNRPGYTAPQALDKGRIKFFDAPLLEISSTLIRQRVQKGLSITYLTPDKVRDYILESGYYK